MDKMKHLVIAIDFTDEPDQYKRAINLMNEREKQRGYIEEFCKQFPNAKKWHIVETRTDWTEKTREFDGALVKSVSFYVCAKCLSTNPMNETLWCEIEPVF